ncbi:NAD(P)-binding protein [Thozetella sp. PMI_491]|nr:NAD(P)-binding protein [Thozetella sp. PMI_491]
MPPKPTSTWTQFFPPKAVFTDKNVSSLVGKVYIVTGGNSGIGKELVQMLYAKNAKVYLAARSEHRASEATAAIKKAVPSSKGEIVFLKLDLNDLTTIKASAESFLAKEARLDVLFNNAGVMGVNAGPDRTAQGYEVNLGVNIIAPFLFTKFLTPVLASTAKNEPAGSVRVVWTSSYGTESIGEESFGMKVDDLKAYEKKSGMDRYGLSKAGVWLLGVECARRLKKEGIASFPLNPGNLSTNLAREFPAAFRFVIRAIVYPPVNGGYTLLFAGLSPELGMENSGSWIIPWGRVSPIRKDLIDATKLKDEGGNGHAAAFWDWNQEQVEKYL